MIPVSHNANAGGGESHPGAAGRRHISPPIHGLRPYMAVGRGKGKWRLLLPGASEPRLTVLTRQGFKSVFQTALRSLSNRSIVVVGNYTIGPITAEPCRAKARPLRPRRSYFGPAKAPRLASSPLAGRVGWGLWWSRRVLPPGPMGLLRRPFIAIAGVAPGTVEYRDEWLRNKDRDRGGRGEFRGLHGPLSRLGGAAPGAARGYPVTAGPVSHHACHICR